MVEQSEHCYDKAKDINVRVVLYVKIAYRKRDHCSVPLDKFTVPCK